MDKFTTCLKPMWQWLKNLFKKPTEVAESLKPKPPTPVAPKVPPVKEPNYTPKIFLQSELIATASKYIGLKETHGKNRSPEIDKIIKTNGGVLGAPYCMYFMQQVVKETCAKLTLKNPLPKGGGTQKVWSLIPDKYKSKTPIPGGLVFWQSKRKKSQGHVGMPTSGVLLAKMFDTIEGNTDGKGARDGDGIWSKSRSMSGSVGLNLLGFVDLAQMILDANKDKPTN